MGVLEDFVLSRQDNGILPDFRQPFTGQNLSRVVDVRGFHQYDPSMADAQRQIGSSVAGAAMPDNPYRSEALETIRRNVAQAMTDPFMGTFVPAKGMETGAFTDLLSKKTMREIADNGMAMKTVIANSPLQARRQMAESIYGKPFKDLTKEEHRELSQFVSSFNLTGGKPLNSVIDHPELFKAEPNLASVDTHLHLGGTEQSGFYGNNKIRVMANNLDSAKPIVLHETQHAVQENANWPRGGSPGDFPEVTANNEALRQFVDRLDLIAEGDFLQKLSNSSAIEKIKLGKQYPELYATANEFYSKYGKFPTVENVKEISNQLWNTVENASPGRQYHNLWGEEQARRTANRMEMTAEERLGRPYGEKLVERPDGTFTYGGKGATDVPNLEDLILRYR